MNDNLRRRWHSATGCFTDDLRSRARGDEPAGAAATDAAVASTSDEWLRRVEALHGEPHRAYHNLSHVEDVLSSLDALLAPPRGAASPEDTAILILAAFFHDVVYNPKSTTNEKDSAGLFLEYASELSNAVRGRIERDECSDAAPDKVTTAQSSSAENTETIPSPENIMVSRVERCIIATATHISSAGEAIRTNDTVVATFLDADMSVLGRDPDRYDEYAGCIRREYEFVERSVYCAKRAEILESFLPSDGAPSDDGDGADGATKKHSSIYATERGRELWEGQARRNLRREIDMLRRGVIPCENER